MKKIFLLLTVFSMVFASCDPMEDIYTDLDTQEAVIAGNAEITLTDDDYGDLGLSSTYFDTVDDAKSMIPGFLSDKYPVWGKNSSAVVTFNVDQLVEKMAYTVTQADYDAVGVTSLRSDDDFNDMLSHIYATPEKGNIVDLTYLGDPVITDYTLTDDDYDLVGNGRYDNFDIRSGKDDETEEARRAKIQTILLANFPNSAVGTKYEVTYAVYDGSSGTRITTVVLTENIPASIENYTLTDDDYDSVGNGRFDNFDIRDGKAEESIEARRAKIETILLAQYPAAATGDAFEVTYDIYDGSSGTRTMLLKFNGTGYDIFSVLNYELYTFALETKTGRFAYVTDWSAPFTLASADYRAMGQSYDNFNGRNADQKAEALRLIAVYLKTIYPFAAAEDFVAVQFRSYEGSGVTATENVNFTFDGTVWTGITNKSMQFGHDGTTWAPDNTIKYTLTSADYALVGNDRYNNFDVRTGKDEETVEARLAKINTILLNNFPADEDGQKYLVTYNIYNGANGVWEMAVIKSGGAYVLQ
jgi:hypothetical protein